MAYEKYFESIENASNLDFESAERLFTEGDVEINKAHKFQTDLLVAEARNEDIPFSIILIHAQDHLMNTISFSRIAAQFIKLYKEREI